MWLLQLLTESSRSGSLRDISLIHEASAVRLELSVIVTCGRENK